MKNATINSPLRGFLLAEALLGLTVLVMTVAVAAQTMQNAQRWWKQAEQSQGLAEEAERMWLEIQLGQTLAMTPDRNRHQWSVASVSGPYGFSLLQLTADGKEKFYVSAPR